MAIATPNDNMGGYDHDFVETPYDRFICKICRIPSRDPYLSVCCGHLFCKSCLDNVKKTATITNACPVCRDEKFVTFPNKAVDREIKSLHIYCTNKEKGCEWQGELNNINNHLGNSKGCQFEEVKCSNECGKMIQRRYLTSHVETECPCRKVNCQYCHDTGEHEFIEGQHKEECPKLPLPCPNKCEVGSVPHEDMEAHRKECPLEMIQCEYYSVGCEVRMAHKDQEKHENENMKEHLMMIKSELTDTKAQLAIAFTQINNLTVSANLMQYTSNSILVAKWSITLDVMATIFKSGHRVCPVTIKMSEYYRNKKGEVGVQQYSDPFYSHHNGYKMCLNVVAAGYDEGKGTHLTVLLHVMKGPHDDELTWPLTGKFEIRLLNQISDSEHRSWILTFVAGRDAVGSRVNRSEIGWGLPWHISNTILNKITPTYQFLKDDCLFIQVTKL